MSSADRPNLGPGPRTDGVPEMEATGSITVMIQNLRQNADQRAAHDLYRRYFAQLVSKLRGRINRRVQSVSDSEDAAHYVLAEILGNLVEGRYPDLADRDSLWALMVHIGDLRTKQMWRHATARRRDVRLQQPQPTAGGPDAVEPFDPMADTIPADMLMEIADMIEHLSRQFSKKEYQAILALELQGYTPAEIKDQLERQLQRTVPESSLRRWRRLMREELKACFPQEYPPAE